MWERFTNNAKYVVSYARQAASNTQDDLVQIEHLLLAVCLIPDCVAARTVTRMGAALNEIVARINAESPSGTPDIWKEGIAFAVPAKRTLEHAVEEARGMNHSYLGTEHILLGILGEECSLAAQTLQAYGINLSDARSQVRRLLNENKGNAEGEGGTSPDSR